MNSIKTITAKNGQTYYYLDGKRISQAKAMELMTQADAPKAQIAVSNLPRHQFITKQTDYIKRQELLAQRTHYINQRMNKAKATLKGLSKATAITFLMIAIVALSGLISSAITIASISALLAVSAPLMLVAYRSQTDAVDKLKSEQEQCLLRTGEYANPERHLSAFMQTKVGNYNCSKLLSGI